MAKATSRITIQRSVEDVFAVLTDVEQTGRWFPVDVEEHWTSPPPHGVGSTRHAIVTMFGRRSENDAVTTEYDPPFRAAMRGTSSNAPFAATLAFADDGSRTRVTVTTEFLLRGPSRIAGPVITFLYGRMWGKGLRELKRMMEAGEL